MRNLGACWLVIAAILTGCSSSRDLDLGGNRYMVTATGNSYANFSLLEQTFAQRAQEVARLHGFDSYRVIQLSSGFEHTPLGPRPTVKGVVFLYNQAKTMGSNSARPTGAVGTATAFVVSPDGVLLTNAHVAGNCREISVRQLNGTTSAASLLATDATNDLALIKIMAPTPDIAQFRGVPDIRQGDNVIAVGFPLHDILSAGTTLTTGTVSALAGVKNDSRTLQVSAPLQHGNSGGPVLDQSGNVVGIVSSGFDKPLDGSMPQNVNFAIKTTVMRAFMDANGIAYRVTQSDKPLSTAEIGERARKFTDFVTCTS